MTRYPFPQSAILDILERLLWWILGHEKCFSHSKKNSSYFCDFFDICYFFYTVLIAVFFKSFLLKLRKQFASKFLLTRSILDISAFLNRIVSEQRTCFHVKGGFGNELLVAI